MASNKRRANWLLVTTVWLVVWACGSHLWILASAPTTGHRHLCPIRVHPHTIYCSRSVGMFIHQQSGGGEWLMMMMMMSWKWSLISRVMVMPFCAVTMPLCWCAKAASSANTQSHTNPWSSNAWAEVHNTSTNHNKAAASIVALVLIVCVSMCQPVLRWHTIWLNFALNGANESKW